MVELTSEQHDELAVAYASLILFDGEAEITSDAINTVLAASKNSVEPYWPMLFANILAKEGKILELLSSGGASSGAAASAGAVSAGAAGEAAAAEDGKKKKEESEEEADLGGGMDMFGGGADY